MTQYKSFFSVTYILLYFLLACMLCLYKAGTEAFWGIVIMEAYDVPLKNIKNVFIKNHC